MVLEENRSPVSAIMRAANRILKSRSADEILHALTEATRALIGAHHGIAQISIGEKALLSASFSDKYPHWAVEHIEAIDFRWFPECGDRPMRLSQEELESHSGWNQVNCAPENLPP